MEGAAHRHAAALLRTRGIAVVRVVKVEPYAIVYVAGNGTVHTAWLRFEEDKKQCQVRSEAGLPAFPTDLAGN